MDGPLNIRLSVRRLKVSFQASASENDGKRIFTKRSFQFGRLRPAHVRTSHFVGIECFPDFPEAYHHPRNAQYPFSFSKVRFPTPFLAFDES